MRVGWVQAHAPTLLPLVAAAPCPSRIRIASCQVLGVKEFDQIVETDKTPRTICVSIGRSPQTVKETLLPAVPRILLLDDNLAVAVAHARVLKQRGLTHIEVCTSPVGALERIARGERFDIIVCDGRMSELDGVDFYQCALELWPAIRHRIVFLTGGLAEVHLLFIAQHHLPIFPKPLGDSAARAELVAIVRRLGLVPH